jgi:hypothetical protein
LLIFFIFLPISGAECSVRTFLYYCFPNINIHLDHLKILLKMLILIPLVFSREGRA